MCLCMYPGPGGEPGVFQVRHWPLDRAPWPLPLHRHAGHHLCIAHLWPGRIIGGFGGVRRRPSWYTTNETLIRWSNLFFFFVRVGSFFYLYLCALVHYEILNFLSASRCLCLGSVLTSRETGTTTGRRIAMLEPSERLASTTPSLRHCSSTDWPRRARSASTCDADQQTDVLTWAPKWPLALLCAYWPADYSPLLRPRSGRASVAGFQMKITASPSGKSNQVLTTLVL